MSLYVISEQVGLDGYWITDILCGIKNEADKKNLHIETFPSNIVIKEGNAPVVLVVGYSAEWTESVCRHVMRCGARPIAVNACQNQVKGFAAAAVGFDYDGAVCRALAYLYSCGKRSVAFLGCRGNRMSFDCKKNAFEENSSRYSFENIGFFEAEGINEAVSDFLAEASQFDAVICSRDVEAGAVGAKLQKKGISLSGQLYTVSFGDNAMARYFTPSLTTLQTDFAALGSEAVRLSRHLLLSGCQGFVSSLLECPITVRESTEYSDGGTLDKQRPLAVPAYRSDAEYISYLQAEALVRSWDALDQSIVECLVEGYNTVEIAEKLFVSPSSVKYRIKKMLTVADLDGRSNLVSLVKKYSML